MTPEEERFEKLAEQRADIIKVFQALSDSMRELARVYALAWLEFNRIARGINLDHEAYQGFEHIKAELRKGVRPH
jgi:hypothetical protein